MADGNFNRSPLSTNNYQSGVRAGKAAMRTIAEQGIRKILQEQLSDLPQTKIDAIILSFKQYLNQ